MVAYEVEVLMKAIYCVRKGTIVLMFLLAGCNGCTADTKQNGGAKDIHREALSGAFHNADCPYLFMIGEYRDLEDILGSSLPKDFLAGIEHTSDGRTLRIRNYDRTP